MTPARHARPAWIARAACTLGLLLRWSAAQAAIPLSLPPGEAEADWQAAARMAGFELRATPATDGVRLTRTATGWEIRVTELDGTERAVPVAAPTTAREREDLLWLAASLAAPLDASAPRVPTPARPVTPTPSQPVTPAVPAPAPLPPAARPTPKPTPPPRSQPPPAVPAPVPVPAPDPVPVPAPAPAPVPAPIPAPAPATPEPEPPAPAPRPPVTPRLAAWVGPDLTGGLGGSIAELGLRVDAWAGAAVGRGLVGLDLARLGGATLEDLGDTESLRRAELALEGGRLLGPRGDAWLLGRAGVGIVSFYAGDPPERLGGLRTPLLGLRAGMERPIAGGLRVGAQVGLDLDLAEIQVYKEGDDTALAVPRSRAQLQLGISWSP